MCCVAVEGAGEENKGGECATDDEPGIGDGEVTPGELVERFADENGGDGPGEFTDEGADDERGKRYGAETGGD